ncbi:MAG: oligopeptide/dipeptide ABC transporter ATP-binding protein [Bacilli bacterium]
MENKYKKFIEDDKESIQTEKVLEVKDLRISFKTDNGKVQAVRGVSFDLHRGETLCIVGESGSGKSVTSKAVMGILSANAIVEGGQIIYQGEDLLKVSEDEFHRIRGHKIGMIFQDPLSSLNPIVKIGKQITETMMINKNQLKNRYSDLISKELTAYKNAKVIKNSTISYSLSSMNATIADMKEKLKAKEDEACSVNNKRIESALRVVNCESEAAEIEKSFDNDISVNVKAYTKNKSQVDKLSEKISLASKKTDVSAKKLIKKLSDKQALFQEACDIHFNEVSELKKELKEKLDKLLLERNENARNIGFPVFRVFNGVSSKKSAYAFIQKEQDEIKAVLSTFKSEEILIKNKQEELAAKHKETVAKANEKYKNDLPSLKEALKIRKGEAKLEIKKYKTSLKIQFEKDFRNLEKEKEPVVLSAQKIKKEIRSVYSKYTMKVMLVFFSRKKKKVLIAKRNSQLKILKDLRNKYIQEINSLVKKEEETKRKYHDSIKISKAEAKRQALEVMKEVGIPQPEKRYYQYPFQFSGGMRQRIVIAIALTAAPDILICDEPTTALDVTIQAQILELINNLKKERNLSCIFITHDLGVVANMADRVAVMYAGKICEYGTDKEIFFDPRHPYTWALLSSIPDIDSKEKLEAIPGTPPDMIYPPVGDAFAARNKYAMAIDFKYQPPYFKISDTHYAATWLLYKDAPRIDPPKIVTSRINKALEEEAKNEKQ